MNKIKITYMKIEDIKPYSKNPRMNERAVSGVAMSIKEYGFSVPIIVDKKNVIIAGHTRYAAAQRLEMEELPVIQKTDLSPAEVKAFRIADNKVSEASSWDKDLLKLEMEALAAMDIDLEITGFKEHEINKLFKEAEIKQDNLLTLDKIECFVKPGEVWQLGDHRLICGDSSIKKTYQKLMGTQQIDLLITDPPYGVDYESANKGINEANKKIDNDNIGEAALEEFLIKVNKEINEFMKPGAAFYIFHADTMGLAFRHSVKRVKWKLAQVLVWIKNMGVMGRQDYHWAHEPILYGWKQPGKHYFDKIFTENTVLEQDNRDIKKMKKNELLVYAKELQDRLEDGASFFREDKPMNSSLHPTMKPVDLVARLMKNSSKPGDLIFDAFGGSGTTLIAAEQLDRKCYMIEMDPKFASGIIIRWQMFTGEKAVKINE